MNEKIDKDFYTTSELIEQSWFPIKSTITIKKFIEQGELDAVNVSTNPDIKRYRISKKSAQAFIERRQFKKE